MNGMRFTVRGQFSPRNQIEGLGFPVAIEERMRNLQPWAQGLPEIIRRGEGSLEQQIQTRTYLDLEGGATAWREPAYATGAQPEAARRSEAVMFDAVLAQGPGSITRINQAGCEIGVNDLVVRQLSATLPNANGIVSTASYFGFVTGDFTERTTDGLARAVKPTRPASARRKGVRGSGSGVRPQNITAVSAKLAMYWFLGLNYGYWPTEAELTGGIPTPPKNMGISRKVVERATTALFDHLLGPESGFRRNRKQRSRAVA